MTTLNEARAAIVESARALEDDSNRYLQNLSADAMASPYNDFVLAAAIQTISLHGFADEVGGDVDHGLAFSRCERWVLWTDSAGFHELVSYADADAATLACEEGH